MPFRLLPIALAPSDRSVLHARIARRFDQMLATGLIDELRGLRARYRLDLSMPSMRCVGYRQAWEFLDGICDEDALRERGIAATRQLAKRQLTWQRQFRETWPDLVELDCLRTDLADAVLATARALLDRT
jgi:tRNA dimethylallyltransferase